MLRDLAERQKQETRQPFGLRAHSCPVSKSIADGPCYGKALKCKSNIKIRDIVTQVMSSLRLEETYLPPAQFLQVFDQFYVIPC